MWRGLGARLLVAIVVVVLVGAATAWVVAASVDRGSSIPTWPALVWWPRR